MPLGLAFLLAMGMVLPFSSNQFLQAAEPQQGMKVDVQEVVIDMVARDKKGLVIADLKENEIEIQEDGVKQKISSFRLVNAGGGATDVTDPLQKIKLVTMVFEQMQGSPEAKKVAVQAVGDFVSNTMDANTVVAMFTLDMRLNLVQQYTNNKETILNAAKRAVGSSRESLSAQSEALQKQLVGILNGAPVPADKPELGGTGDRQLDLRLAQLVNKTMGHGEVVTIQTDWRPLIYSMRAIGQEQAVVPGRKTILYFSWGIWVPREQLDALQNLISTLNRAHVSVYPVYIAGLSTWSQAQGTKEALDNAADASRTQAQRSSGGVSSWEVRSGESAEGSIRSNGLQNMTDFCKATSGMLMGDTNDFQTPMKNLAQDINNYYELSYVPTNTKLDGSFRKVNVKVPRAKTVLARNGYLALPSTGGGGTGSTMLPYETPMAEILSQPNPPHAFDYRIKVPQFENRQGRQHFALLLEVPFSSITLVPDENAKKVKAQIGVMALIKDSDGKVVEKLSQFLPYEPPIERMETLKSVKFVFNKDFTLPQGKYTIESVFMDKLGNKASTMKTPLEVPAAPAGLQVSTLHVIKRADPANPNDTDMGNPYRLGSQKLSPYVEDPVTLKVGEPLILYFVAYPAPASTDKPQLKLQVIQAGTSLGELPVELPPVDAQGRIQYTGTLPTNAFPAGNYEFKAMVTQGNMTAETKTAVNLIQ